MKNRIGVLIIGLVVNVIAYAFLHIGNVTDGMRIWTEVKLFAISYLTWTGFLFALYEYNRSTRTAKAMGVPDGKMKVKA